MSYFPPSKRGQDVVEGGGRSMEVVGKRGGFMDEHEKQRQLTKLLVNVNIEKSLGPVKLVMSPENTVCDLIKASIEIYVKEKRRPLLDSTDPKCFELHYSQFSLQRLKPDEKLMNLGSRNFFLCLKSAVTASSSD
ncbi:putative protein-like [Forsythia ovata]|uniref:DUF7054 domain-containing protein n=1 Tax=Forsythia ovata TaxID=205694 RepID=A0ABD1WFE1_9LAMI